MDDSIGRVVPSITRLTGFNPDNDIVNRKSKSFFNCNVQYIRGQVGIDQLLLLNLSKIRL